MAVRRCPAVRQARLEETPLRPEGSSMLRGVRAERRFVFRAWRAVNVAIHRAIFEESERQSRRFSQKFSAFKAISEDYIRQSKLSLILNVRYRSVVAKNARFEQRWRSRKGDKGTSHEKLHEMCHFFDVILVDVEERSNELRQEDEISLEDQRMLNSYLPLLREFIPSATSEIESDLSANSTKQVCLPEPPTISCDNLSALALSSNPIYHSRIKHLDIDFHFVRERVQRNDLTVQYIPTEEQVADVFTKGLHSPVFLSHCANMRLGNLELDLRGNDNSNS
ncbi:hypothetical protein L3X38_002008 [Prunus dulcis]|uniref:Uncharacterized protein n=1 Tax=Prunus dulcis TaxID=3755 RepID=A0AAD4WTR4_PRUDU|nr:hypothetical protein L3X38_002008 [Prunus dulcis]